MSEAAGRDTIYALASPPGKGAVAVIRVSGPQALDGLRALTDLKAENVTARHAYYKNFKEPVSRETLDEGLAVFFQAPASFTGEDVVEYFLHGGRAVTDSFLKALGAMAGYRMAEPGEFTRRAFENEKLDLTEAEAVADLVDAETALQKSQALDQLGGALSDMYQGWAGQLKADLAHLEADLEFPDEDLPEGLWPEIRPRLETMLTDIEGHLDDNQRGERLRDGLQIAIIGAPNAGKSSLVNALARRDVAIVSETAGTTRDIIEVHLDLNGAPVILADTAGLRPEQLDDENPHDRIESEGIRRALEKAQNADIRILLFDAGRLPDIDAHTMELKDEHSLIVWNKSDLADAAQLETQPGLEISAEKGTGLEALTDALAEKAADLIGSRDTPSLTRARHREALQECVAALQRALEAPMPELAAEDMRLALRALGKITGRVHVEDLLDVIFKDFCIGK